MAYPTSKSRNVSTFDRIRRDSCGGTKGGLRRQDFGILPIGSDWIIHQPPICREKMMGYPANWTIDLERWNAVVPQIPEIIGRMIMAVEEKPLPATSA